MKSISENFTKIIKGIALGGVVFIGVNSCSSRDDKSEDLNNSAKATLNFNIVGIENAGSVSASASVNKQDGVLAGSSVIAKESTVSLKDFDVLTSIEKVGSGGLGAVASSAGMNGAVAATQPMAAGVKYLIQVYVAGTTTNPVVNQVATAGTNPLITVPAGQSYDWYVFSTNDATAPVINNGVISSSTIANKDVLYAKSAAPVSVQSGQNDLAVSFHRHTIRMDVNVDARGLFGKIDNTTTVELGTGTGGSFASIVKSGDLNIFTGAYSNIQTIPAVIQGSSMVNTAGAQGDVGATKTASFYTVDASANAISANLSVRLGTLGVNMDDNTLRTFSGASVVYTNAAITPVIGTQYLLNARMIESGIAEGTAVWARTNLQYMTSAVDKYRFLPTNDIPINALLNILDLVQLGLNGNTFNNQITNLYWNWNATTPTGTAGSGDPCALVYPAGKWRTPTKAEFDALGSDNTAAGRYVDVGNGVIANALFAGQFPIPGTVDSAFPVHSQRLFMPMYGYRASSGTIMDSPSSLLPLVTASVTSNYWSSGTTGNGVKFYRSLTTLLAAVALDTGYSTPVEGGPGKGMSVRCVRS
ncbi:fibrobacter succinogenes major paralogous domain-containing protein [Elizabethkingia ursingii]|uniref:fibrobacter succinogenes major paralogous domain-containing protein n=1 Tax=Elizabethkingia ursingii TaxID=1756150 RepID=UPI002013434E|nr:fibrobacter succinogenes major paralogous domain-containing protein [Elizabethkingia ursingii]MCL1669392.1 fibrobacter succinogenes major paralogous domain-containing protein [Elizabethkingia ursingii]